MLNCRAGVVGSPIDHSLSPALHRAAYAELGLTGWRYDRFAVGGPGEPGLAAFLAGLDEEWVGLSVTMPLKEDAVGLAVAASGHARELGAANTLVRGEAGWIAESTDAYGVLEALLEAGVGRSGPDGRARPPRRAVVLGSGATARSVLDALARIGTREVTFVVRRAARPETVEYARRAGMSVAHTALDGGTYDDLIEVLAAADVTVSTLPTGTDLGLVSRGEGLVAGKVVMDVVYGGWPTPLAAWASAEGARVVSGLDMLIHQAAEQVRLMTGRPGPVAAMRAAVRADASAHPPAR